MKVVSYLVAALITAVPLPGCASGIDAMDKAPESFKLQDRALQAVARKELQAIDPQSLLARESDAGRASQRPAPLRFAVSEEVAFSLENAGTWQDVAGGRLWRLVIRAPQALSVSLLFSRFDMPEGAKLWLYDPGGKRIEGPFSARDRSPRGRLSTPVIAGDEVVVEVFAPAGAAQPVVIIGSVNKGFRVLN